MKRLRITVEGKAYEVEVEMLDDDGQPSASPPPRPAAPRRSATARSLSAVVVSVDVAIGQSVNEGDRLITLEAMKMNTVVNAPRGGSVAAIHVAPGDAVEEGQGLVSLG